MYGFVTYVYNYVSVFLHSEIVGEPMQPLKCSVTHSEANFTPMQGKSKRLAYNLAKAVNLPYIDLPLSRFNTVTYMVVQATKMMDSSSDDWIY
jgi:hypothetical protein